MGAYQYLSSLIGGSDDKDRPTTEPEQDEDQALLGNAEVQARMASEDPQASGAPAGGGVGDWLTSGLQGAQELASGGLDLARRGAETVNALDATYNPVRRAGDALGEQVGAAYRAWMGTDEAQEMRASHDRSNANLEQEAQEEAGPQGVGREDIVGSDVKQTVRAGEHDGLDSTLALANTRAEKGDAGTHYKRDGATYSDKEAQFTGEADRDTFWCSGFNLWTLGAAGYDLNTPIRGSNGEDHGYVDANGYMPIRPWMLMDGQWEAVQAMGQILKECSGGSPEEVPGYTVWIETNEIRDLSGVERKVGQKTFDDDAGEVIREGSTDVSTGFTDDSLYEEGTTSDTESGSNYDDSAAVMGAPGAFELMGIGERVDIQSIRPGDFAQAFWKNGGKYYGSGHAWQVWSVTVRGSAWFGVEGSPTLVDGDPPAERTWLTDVEFRIDDTTDSNLVADDVVVQTYQAIEANTAGAAGTGLAAGGDGGVAITTDRELDFRFDQYDDRREYYGRLFESPWSSKNFRGATGPGAEPDQDEGQEPEAEAQAEGSESALAPLWRAMGWE